jgi:putative spermidine/putrescine transport system ATP-binding protein
MTEKLVLDRLTARYGATTVLEDFSLAVAAGELVSLLGASGCGKTTTLRLVAGFLEPAAGTIRLGDKDLTKLPAHKRDIGLVFQNYALFPHLSVLDNIAFGLKQRGIPSAEREKRARAMLDRVDLGGLADRLPGALSGGQKQRVALARALVIEPPLLMFDEPLSNLDAKLRVDMRVEIRQLQRANGTTSVYVTHDQEEAFSISDRVAIMDKGRIMQLDAPEILYQRPANAFVARFVGFENLVPLKVVARDGDGVVAEAPGGARLELPQERQLSRERFGVVPDTFMLAARADGFAISPVSSAEVSNSGVSDSGIPVKIDVRTYLGRAYQYKCTSAAGTLIANGNLANPLEIGSSAMLTPLAEQCAILKPE